MGADDFILGDQEKVKIVKDFKRGDKIPIGSKFLSSRQYTKTESYDGGHPYEWDERIVDQYWIDTYEVYIN